MRFDCSAIIPTTNQNFWRGHKISESHQSRNDNKRMNERVNIIKIFHAKNQRQLYRNMYHVCHVSPDNWLLMSILYNIFVFFLIKTLLCVPQTFKNMSPILWPNFLWMSQRIFKKNLNSIKSIFIERYLIFCYWIQSCVMWYLVPWYHVFFIGFFFSNKYFNPNIWAMSVCVSCERDVTWFLKDWSLCDVVELIFIRWFLNHWWLFERHKNV